MKFISTQGGDEATPSAAILKGIAADGGLFVPERIPQISESFIDGLLPLSYPERAAKIMELYFDDFTYSELLEITSAAAERFEEAEPAPVSKLDNQTYVLELWHGPTAAFKDLALTILPALMALSAKKQGLREKILVLTATSGDTGKAALEGFCGADGIKIMTVYPGKGVSRIQKLQMTTQGGDNVNVLGLEGNFDDAQTAVKKLFTDPEFNAEAKKAGYVLSSANSINLGRLIPQIAYYFSAYCDMLAAGEIKKGARIAFCVPTGNFGNILAGWYAYKMGLPVCSLICASNSNNVLYDFFTRGTYSLDRKFFRTISPSMDILISSNLERLIFEISGRNAALTKERMTSLKTAGEYSVTPEELKALNGIFRADFETDEGTLYAISHLFEAEGYLADPHTAVAVSALNSYFAAEQNPSKCVVISTASPYKFCADVLRALALTPVEDEAKNFKKLYNISALPVPSALTEVLTCKVRFDRVTGVGELYAEVLEFLRADDK